MERAGPYHYDRGRADHIEDLGPAFRPKAADGTRAGGVTGNQQDLLRKEGESAIASVSFLMMVEWLMLALGLAAGITIALLTARSIATPVQGMTQAMSALAAGDLNVTVPAQDNKDELGEMAKAVLVFRDAAVDKQRMEREAEAGARAQRGGAAPRRGTRPSSASGPWCRARSAPAWPSSPPRT